ncbi:helix-turn-helix domain-containing protein [uncultured Oscillibacter sp.]|uniref:helix-turn-helix domain-containing protein n=1 Tax=uncultured Oscillibacter sp. TaxID=876091 RepID=UPI00345DD3BF
MQLSYRIFPRLSIRKPEKSGGLQSLILSARKKKFFLAPFFYRKEEIRCTCRQDTSTSRSVGSWPKPWEGGQSVRQIAQTMGVHETTIYRELRRGEAGTNVLDGNYRRRYDPELAQKRFMEHLYSRPMGRPRKTGN